MAVADVVEALCSHRPYRPARGLDAALEELEQYRGTLYAPEAVDACLALFREGRFDPETWSGSPPP
jgi:HD-GYP domain-containing protein (c-di-GMP phosphodiesterase class II)